MRGYHDPGRPEMKKDDSTEQAVLSGQMRESSSRLNLLFGATSPRRHVATMRLRLPAKFASYHENVKWP
jgi:hypothetical protein